MERSYWINDLTLDAFDIDEAQDDLLFRVYDASAGEFTSTKLTREQVAEVRDELTRWLNEKDAA